MLLRYGASIALFLFGVGLQVSPIQDIRLSIALWVIAILLLIPIVWNFLRRIRLSLAPLQQSALHKQEPKRSERELSNDIEKKANWWSEVEGGDRTNLAERIMVVEIQPDWHHLTKKSVGQSCWIDFHFRICNATVYTIELGHHIEGHLIYNGHPLERPLEFVPSGSSNIPQRGTYIYHSYLVQITFRQWLAENIALDIWHEADKEAVFDFKQMAIWMNGLLPDRTRISTQKLFFQNELKVRVPSYQELGQWIFG